MKTSLITGVSRGIGKALAQKFLAERCAVIGTSITGKLDWSDKNLSVVPLDLSLPKSIEHACDEVEKRKTNIDILINNAGIQLDTDETNIVVDKLRKTLEVNLIGTIDFTEQIVPLMNKSGAIINISSQAGSLTDAPNMADTHYPYHYPAYKISKCAINMYTRTLALRLEHEDNRGIRVSSVHPGWVRTDMGGDEAPTTPEEAADDIYKLAISRPETGQFWFKGKKYPW